MQKKVPLLVIPTILMVTLMACQLTGLTPTIQPAIATSAPAVFQPVSAANLVNQQDQLVAIYNTVNPGVVTIRIYNSSDGSLIEGSGWVYSADGYVITNAHVVSGATKVEVDFPSGLKTYGTVVGANQRSDLAVIKVDVPADQLHPLTLGDSEALQVGQIVTAIGNPLLLNGTMTTGIVSALGRSVPSGVQAASGGYYAAGDIIQTDALLNPGNSGGPLLNLDGQVVGVNFMMERDPTSGAPSGIGYAISINTVKRVVPELIQNGKFGFPYLGISTRDDLPLDVINTLGLKSTTGAYVTIVTPGGPADRAGIRAGTQTTSIQGLNSGGDLIIAVDGQPVQVFDDLMRYLVLHKSPGDTVTLTVLRGEQQLDVSVTLGTSPT
jgi:2-alkenal reductase